MNKLLYLCLVTMVMWASPMLAQINGEIDSSFATNGVLVDDVNGLGQRQYIYDFQIGPDDKLYVAGGNGSPGNYNALVARFNVDGSLDASFGNNGIALFSPLLNNITFSKCMDIQSDGKIVLAGYATTANNEHILMRLMPNGELDTSFNATGIVTTGYAAGDDIWNSVIVQFDGKITTAGYTTPTANNRNAIVARWNADGTPDVTFGTGGAVQNSLGTTDEYTQVYQFAPNRYYLTAKIDGVYNVIAQNGTGDLVLTFGNNGIANIDPIAGGYTFINHIDVTTDGKILVAGGVEEANGEINSFFCRLNSQGQFDTAFSGDGIFKENMSDGFDDQFTDFELLPDGQILLTGKYETEADSIAYWTMVITTDGYVNTSYGLGGVHIYNMHGKAYGAFLDIDSHGKYYIGGNTEMAGDINTTIVKLKTTQGVGIIEKSSALQAFVQVFPNPFAGALTVGLELETSQQVTIYITDLTGKVIVTMADDETFAAGKHQYQTNIDNLSNGMYLLHTVANGASATQRIVKVD